MRSLATQLAAVAAAGLLAGLATTASAQVDHEKCYKIKDPVKLKGIVDLTTPQFGLEPGCKIGKAKYFCVPASKTVISAVDKATGLPIAPLPVYAPDAPVDRICYKVKCPVPPPPFPPDQNVTDQFGNRTLTRFKAAYLCTPAVKGAAFCGNGVIDPGEDCDGGALGLCTVGCRPNCTCMCETACCYVEQPPLPPAKPAPDAECFEYSGNPAQVAAFIGGCTNAGPAAGVPGSLVPPFLVNSAGALGPCAPGPPSPVFGLPCIPGPPTVGNLHILPSDSTCP
jgi:hypothetical protein